MIAIRIFSPKKIKILFALLASATSVACYSQSDNEVQQVDQYVASRDNIGLQDNPLRFNAIPAFFAKENTQGFQFFSHHWLRGVVIYADNQNASLNDTTLKIDNTNFYNFDKYNNKLVSTQGGKNVISLSNDAVSKFILVDSGKAYIFKKNPSINKSFYFQPMVESENGYSLYKHISTQLKRADYQNIGYGTTGKKYDEYVDSYEYYLVFPGGKEFRKMSLNKSTKK
jgi:hypothetical protein